MKKSMFCLLLLYAFTATAQVDPSNLKIDTSKLKTIELPDSTAIGAPYGNVVSKMIGQDGGSLTSEDGKLELIFPEGALTANTTITIQSTRNMLDSSKCAYQLEPSGTQFKKPVQVIFHYTDKEAEECPPDLKSFALQDHNGKWSYLEYANWDSSGKTLSGFIQHFSVLVTDQNDVLLKPEKSDLGLNDQTLVYIYHKDTIVTGEFAGQPDDPEFASNRLGFFVNGILKGNEQVGTGDILSTGTNHIGHYKAPHNLPAKNPVEIKVAFKYYSRLKKKLVWGKATCAINIWDAYQITIMHKFYTRSGMDGVLIDRASCVAHLSPHNVVIDKIVNNKPEVIREGRNPPFREKLFVDDALGTIHLTEAIRFPKDMNANYPKEVYFEFETVPAVLYKFKTGARGIWSETESMIEKTLAITVWFLANGKEQHTTMDVGAKEYCEIVIKPFRE
jgi:hypothetical protein